MYKEINEDIFKQIDKEHSDDYKKHDELYRKAVENKYKEQDDAEERESDKLSHKDWAEKRFTNKNIKGSNKTRSRKIKKLRKDIDRMESAFESLENLNVSEECFDEIIGIVEAIIDETSKEWRQNLIQGREAKHIGAKRKMDVADTALSQAQAKAHSDLKHTPQGDKLKANSDQAHREYVAARDQLTRAKSLADRLNSRIKVTKEKWVDNTPTNKK
jgi:hypothetical protein